LHYISTHTMTKRFIPIWLVVLLLVAACKKFYQPLSHNNSIGQSFKNWWHDYAKSFHNSKKRIHWFYGLCIIGDPFIKFKYNTYYSCNNILNITNYTATDNNIIYYRAKEKIIINTNFEQAIGKHIIFDAPTVIFSEGFSIPNGTTMEILNEGCNCNH